MRMLKQSLQSRVFAKTDFDAGAPLFRPDLGDCWVYNGAKDKLGYASIWYRENGKPRTRRVHRVVYEYFKGAIPDGLVIDHLCRNPSCCNPSHLEAVTNRENVLRGLIGMKTHCKNGHELSGDNLKIRFLSAKRNPVRECVTCTKNYKESNRHKGKEYHSRYVSKLGVEEYRRRKRIISSRWYHNKKKTKANTDV